MLMLGCLVILSAIASQNAFAWGTVGHEEVQSAAVRLLAAQNHPLTRYFEKNTATLKRLAVVPDVEWSGRAQPGPSPKKTGAKATAAALQEQGLHYFEVDAFLRFGTADNAVLELPSGEYLKVCDKYRDLLRENVAYVLEFDRNQSDPSAYGTAPWRALQIYDLAVAELRGKAYPKALFYLGLLSHYVSDLAEPLNTTLNFDGRHYPIPATGVYDAFERRILEEPRVASTVVEHEAEAVLGGKGLDGLTRARIVPELLKLVDNGQNLVDPLLKAFSLQCARAHGSASGRGLASAARDQAKKNETSQTQSCEPPVDAPTATALVRAFATSTLSPTGSEDDELTVQQAAVQRLGMAAVAVARLWAAAYNEAERPAVDGPVVKFESLRARESYFGPNYLKLRPGLGLLGPHR